MPKVLMPDGSSKEYSYSRMGIQKAKNFAKKVGGKVIDATASAIAHIGTRKERKAAKQAEQDFRYLRLDNQTKGVPIDGMDYRNEIFRAKVSAPGIKARMLAPKQEKKRWYERGAGIQSSVMGKKMAGNRSVNRRENNQVS